MFFSNLFSDHAVLQRDSSIPVWGWAKPGERISCCFNNITLSIKADATGKFLLRFPPMKAGGSYTLEAWNEDRTETVVSHDLTIGEVYLAGGQSNMELCTKDTGPYREKILCDLEHTGIRFFTVPKTAEPGVRSNPEGKWQCSSPQTAENFSAVALVFAGKLTKTLCVPVGIISSNWGGTRIESWTSRETLMRNPEYYGLVKQYEYEISRFVQLDIKRLKILQDIPRNHDISNEKLDFLVKHRPLVREDALSAQECLCDNDLESWQSISIPGSWLANNHATYGYLWLKRQIILPAHCAGKPAILHLGGIDKQDITFFNGHKIGQTGTGYQSQFWNSERTYPIPAELVKEGVNQIAIRAFSYDQDGSCNGLAAAFYLECDGKNFPLAGQWFYRQEIAYDYIPYHSLSSPGDAPHGPYILYDNMIYPLIPFAFRGVIWYQGESNAGFPKDYGRLMQDLIQDWRYHFGNGDFSFYQVQLAGFMPEQDFDGNANWAALRNEQFSAFRNTHNTGLAIIIDASDANNIHPMDKITVGQRLAAWALHNDFHIGSIPCGPLFRTYELEPEAIRIYFDYAHGLHSREPELNGFFVSYDRIHFVPVKASIDGETVLLHVNEIIAPIVFRYAWADNPAHTPLYNGLGFPASPFCSNMAGPGRTAAFPQ